MQLKSYLHSIFCLCLLTFTSQRAFSLGTVIADFAVSKTTVCLNEPIIVTDNSTATPGCGTINQHSWNFGIDASPATANTIGPHTVSWSSAGTKTLSLTATTTLTCSDTETKNSLITVLGTCNFAIPTLSEWGLFTLLLISLSLSIVLMVQPQLMAKGEKGYQLNMGVSNYIIPLNEVYLKKSLLVVGGMIVTYFSISLLWIGTILASDLAGIIYAGFVLTYFIHLIWLLKDSK